MDRLVEQAGTDTATPDHPDTTRKNQPTFVSPKRRSAIA
jgi:hypothetical protein